MENIVTVKMSKSKQITYAALLLALGLILPRITGMIPIAGINSMLSPMHIPLLLAGFILSWKYSLILGISLPLVSFLLTGMPPLFPIGLAMMGELATYGIVAYFLYQVAHKNIYLSLIIAMLCGRIVLGIMNTILLSAANIPYGFEAFLTSAFVTAIPGIILHLIVVPPLVNALKKSFR